MKIAPRRNAVLPLAEAKEKELVKGYEEFRTFFGEMNFRRIEWK